MTHELTVRCIRVTGSGEMMAWLGKNRVGGAEIGWRKIAVAAITVYEMKFGIHYEYMLFDEGGVAPVDVPATTYFSEERARRYADQLNATRKGELFVHRRLAGDWERL